jgi:hypothetical protein
MIQKIQKKDYEETRAKIQKARANLQKVIDQHEKEGHVYVPMGYMSVGCEICDKDFGWWCPDSPNHCCQYSKSEDSCDYCHQPLERK